MFACDQRYVCQPSIHMFSGQRTHSVSDVTLTPSSFRRPESSLPSDGGAGLVKTGFLRVGDRGTLGNSTTPSFPSQPEGKIGLPRANPRGSQKSPSFSRIQTQLEKNDVVPPLTPCAIRSHGTETRLLFSHCWTHRASGSIREQS